MLAAVKLSVAAVTFVPLFVVRLVKKKGEKLDETDVNNCITTDECEVGQTKHRPTNPSPPPPFPKPAVC